MKKMMFNDRYGLTDAVLEKRKTVTRRTIIAPNWACDVTIGYDGAPIASDGNECADRMRCERIKPPYKVGEIVAVAQRYSSLVPYSSDRYYPELMEAINEAHCLCCEHTGHLETVAGWANKMFVYADLMPHQIRILDVRAERLQDITEEDCLREGVRFVDEMDGYNDYYLDYPQGRSKKIGYYSSPREAFASLIDKISGRGTWATNPYVWRIEFELVK